MLAQYFAGSRPWRTSMATLPPPITEGPSSDREFVAKIDVSKKLDALMPPPIEIDPVSTSRGCDVRQRNQDSRALAP